MQRSDLGVNNVTPVQRAGNSEKRIDPSVECNRYAVSLAEIVVEITDRSWLPSATDVGAINEF